MEAGNDASISVSRGTEPQVVDHLATSICAHGPCAQIPRREGLKPETIIKIGSCMPEYSTIIGRDRGFAPIGGVGLTPKEYFS